MNFMPAVTSSVPSSLYNNPVVNSLTGFGFENWISDRNGLNVIYMNTLLMYLLYFFIKIFNNQLKPISPFSYNNLNAGIHNAPSTLDPKYIADLQVTVYTF